MELTEQIDDIFDDVVEILGDEKAFLWMFSKNPLLGNVSPLRLIEMGRYEKLRQFVDDAESFNREGER